MPKDPDKITILLKYPILKSDELPTEVIITMIDPKGMTAEDFRGALIEFMVEVEAQGEKLFHSEFDSEVNLQ